MSMNPALFLKNLERLITGDGFKRTIQGIDLNSIKSATGVVLTATADSLYLETIETYAEVILVKEGTTGLGMLRLLVPQDYDEDKDYLRIRFLAQSAGDTNTPTIDAALYRKRAGAALSADLGPTISGAVSNNTGAGSWVEINADSLSLQGGDALTIDFTTSAHGTDKLHIYAIEVVYKSDLVYYDGDDR